MLIPINLNKKLGDYVIERIRQELSNLSWLEEIYPAVQVGVRENKDTYPQLYRDSGKEKILDLTPTTELKSYCFFEKRNYSIGGFENEFNLSLILWGQLDVIDSTKEYDYKDELIHDIINVLKSFTAENITVDFEKPFTKYNLHDTKKQIFMYPFFAAKIDFNVKLDDC